MTGFSETEEYHTAVQTAQSKGNTAESMIIAGDINTPPSVAGASLVVRGLSGGADGKESAGKVADPGSTPGPGRSPWRREWLPTPIFLCGEFREQRLQSMRWQ